MVVVGIRDSVAKRFLSVQFFPNDEAACRDFVNAVSVSRGDRQSMLGTNPGDFSIWHLCDYDELTGVFDNQEHFVLMTGYDVVADLESMKGVSDDGQD